MAIGHPVIDLAAFRDLLIGLTGGDSGPSPSAPEDPPLVVVDLESPGWPADGWDMDPLRPLPFVVVGVSRSGRYEGSFDAFDVALVEAAPDARQPPAPWVSVRELPPALERLHAATATAPAAGVALVQVLRAAAGASFGDALVIESLAYSTLQAGTAFARWLGRRARRTPRPEDGEVLTAERRAGELYLTLDRPHARNALNAALRDALHEALLVASLDDSVSSVHLGGSGPDFCSGGDLDEFGTAPDPATAHLVRLRRSPAAALFAVRERGVAHLHGACIGAGIEISAVAGRVVAAPDTWIQLPELSMGLIPGAGGTASLPRRIGRHRTAWLGLTGSVLDAPTAHRWGLVDELAEPEPGRAAGGR